ncbi:MAG: DNA mismatch repair endonuclease MutL [Planctomycetia bacterium]|jgi:DNA mismatch repair protein MutL
MPKIQKLSQSLINKIAAGEVIERPASVVKELMENAIDAGSTRVNVSITNGGADMIRVVDNGTGIEPDDIPLALTAHATSKIIEVDDLFKIGTLGFRGEAMASIAEISRMVLRSRTPQSESAHEIEVVGGKFSELTPCGAPVGTTIEVSNLFYNTPVRRKTLRKTQTEFSHIKEAFTRIAMALPQVDFTLSHNDRMVLDLSGSQSWLERIAMFFGRELAENMIWVESDREDVHISGYVGHPSQSRSNNNMQYLFLNGRHIRDRSLQHALREAYRGLLLTGRYPIGFLNITMPPEKVDVNVHPTKIEVRFHSDNQLYSQLLSMLRTSFLSTDLHSRVRTEDADEMTDPSGAMDDGQANKLRQELVDWAKGEVDAWPQRPGEEDAPLEQTEFGLDPDHDAFDSSDYQDTATPLELVKLGRRWDPPAMAEGEGSGSETSPAEGRYSEKPDRAVQIHDRYIVTESDEGLMIVDQHALHERILYEHLKDRILSGQVEVQNLLVPEPVDLAPSEAAAVMEHKDLLAKLGLIVEPFGGDTILVAGYPAMLANIAPSEVLRSILDRLLDENQDRKLDPTNLLDELLHTIACKAAIKAGERLAPSEITSLLQQRHLIQDAHHCPHGRPTALVFTQKELDKQFKRI